MVVFKVIEDKSKGQGKFKAVEAWTEPDFLAEQSALKTAEATAAAESAARDMLNKMQSAKVASAFAACTSAPPGPVGEDC
eukprot:9342416-Karenia_brevis.AAC.1